MIAVIRGTWLLARGNVDLSDLKQFQLAVEADKSVFILEITSVPEADLILTSIQMDGKVSILFRDDWKTTGRV